MDPPPSNSGYKVIRIILGSSYIPIIPLLQGGGPPKLQSILLKGAYIGGHRVV